MSRFLLLNFEEFGLTQDITKTIQSQTLFCICCLDRSGPLIDLISCEHSDYLDNFTKPEMKPFNQVVCYQCHDVLKKIKLFKRQVEESFYLLLSESFKHQHENLKKSNLSNFKIYKTVDVLLPQNYSINPQESNFVQLKTSETVEKSKTVDNLNVPPKSSNSEKNKKLSNIKTALDIINKNDSLGILASQIKTLASENIGKAIEIFNKEQNVSKRETCTATPAGNNPPVKNVGTVENSVVAKPEILSVVKIKTEPKEIEIEIPPVSSQVPNQINTQKQVNQPVKARIKTIQLTKEELMRERSLQAQSAAYLKHPYKCEHCLVGFNYKENLEDHSKRKHGPKIASITCEICLQVLFPAGCIIAHNFRHYTRYECMVCSKRYSAYNDAVRHSWLEHTAKEDKIKYKCRFCDFTTSYEKKIKFHTTNSHKKFACGVCEVTFNSKRSLRCHTNTAHKDFTQKCMCASKQMCATTEHLFSCNECKMRFAREDQFHKHMAMNHKGGSSRATQHSAAQPPRTPVKKCSTNQHSSKLNKCTHCEKIFEMETKLISHMSKCSNRVDAYICDHCRRVFKNRLRLIRHLELHK